MIHWKILRFRGAALMCLVAALHGVTSTLTDSEKNNKIARIDSQLKTASEMIGTARKELPNDLKEFCKNNSIPRPIDCNDLYRNGFHKDGIYQIWPQSRVLKGPLKVYCQMEIEVGGWTVIQRRGDFDSPSDYFYKDWSAYKKGFGDLSKDFWIGNDNLFALTSQRLYQIKFDLKDWELNSVYATYDEFWIDDERNSYALYVGGYRGTAGDSFTRQNGAKFSTKDRDNDSFPKSCAVEFKGAWWYTDCHDSNLNGYYLKGPHESFADGVEWRAFKGYKYSLKDTIMKIRPIDLGNEINAENRPQ